MATTSVNTRQVRSEAVTADKVGSGAATNGQVLAADGAGGAAWVNPGGSPIVIKAWAVITGSGGTPSIEDDENVASITDHGTGSWTVTFDTALPNVNYTVAAWARGGGASWVGISGNITVALATTGVRLAMASLAPAAADPSELSITVFGRQ